MPLNAHFLSTEDDQSQIRAAEHVRRDRERQQGAVK